MVNLLIFFLSGTWVFSLLYCKWCYGEHLCLRTFVCISNCFLRFPEVELQGQGVNVFQDCDTCSQIAFLEDAHACMPTVPGSLAPCTCVLLQNPCKFDEANPVYQRPLQFFLSLIMSDILHPRCECPTVFFAYLQVWVFCVWVLHIKKAISLPCGGCESHSCFGQSPSKGIYNSVPFLPHLVLSPEQFSTLPMGLIVSVLAEPDPMGMCRGDRGDTEITKLSQENATGRGLCGVVFIALSWRRAENFLPLTGHL